MNRVKSEGDTSNVDKPRPVNTPSRGTVRKIPGGGRGRRTKQPLHLCSGAVCFHLCPGRRGCRQYAKSWRVWSNTSSSGSNIRCAMPRKMIWFIRNPSKQWPAEESRPLRSDLPYSGHGHQLPFPILFASLDPALVCGQAAFTQTPRIAMRCNYWVGRPTPIPCLDQMGGEAEQPGPHIRL